MKSFSTQEICHNSRCPHQKSIPPLNASQRRNYHQAEKTWRRRLYILYARWLKSKKHSNGHSLTSIFIYCIFYRMFGKSYHPKQPSGHPPSGAYDFWQTPTNCSLRLQAGWLFSELIGQPNWCWWAVIVTPKWTLASSVCLVYVHMYVLMFVCVWMCVCHCNDIGNQKWRHIKATQQINCQCLVWFCGGKRESMTYAFPWN